MSPVTKSDGHRYLVFGPIFTELRVVLLRPPTVIFFVTIKRPSRRPCSSPADHDAGVSERASELGTNVIRGTNDGDKDDGIGGDDDDGRKKG